MSVDPSTHPKLGKTAPPTLITHSKALATL